MMSYQFIKKSMIGLSVLTLSVSTNIFASEVMESQPVETVVQDYFDTMGKEWDAFAELYTMDQVEGFKTFLTDEDNINENVGVLNVQDASLKEMVEIQYADVKDMLPENYDEDVKVFAVGAEFQVNQDTKYFSNGTTYYLLVLENENGSWKVENLAQIAEPDLLKERGYTFNSEYVITENMMTARESGYLVNGDGEVFADIDGNPIENSDLIDSQAILNKRTVPTSKTTISYGTYKNNVYQSRKSINYHDYCLGVSRGEVGSTKFDGAARQAVDIAIKTYTWHYKIVPIDPAHSVDIKNTMQSYQPDKDTSNKKIVTDYNAVKSIWMESYKGNIFAAGYGAGKEDSSGKNGGRLMQNGCVYLAKKGYTKYEMLHYYYDNSTDGSTGGSLRFFDDNKNDLGK